MGVYYIGIFPPKYGGVTIKNENLYNAMNGLIEIEKIDLNRVKRGNLKETVRFVQAIFNRKNSFVVGVAGQRRRFTQLLYMVNKSGLSNSIIFIMGGQAAREIVNDSQYLKYMSYYKKIYVETGGMQEELNHAGLINVDIYPNCRVRSDKKRTILRGNATKKCVFFSLIDTSKGADIVLDAAKILQNTEFHFYGQISNEYENCFLSEIESLPNVRYHGVFKGTPDEVYNELAKYDLLLLPTRWKAEGVPGILVEAKIACLPAVVSDINYNKDIVKNGFDGIVLEQNNTEHVIKAITYLVKNEKILAEMKENCTKSANMYYIDNYVEKILSSIKN